MAPKIFRYRFAAPGWKILCSRSDCASVTVKCAELVAVNIVLLFDNVRYRKINIRQTPFARSEIIK